MAISRVQAKRLCTAAEFLLYQASRQGQINSLKPAELKRKIDRARKLRDKNRDLYQRQQLALKESSASGATILALPHAGSDYKAELFAEVLARFEKRLAALEAAAAKAASKPEKNTAPKAKAKAKPAATATPKAATKAKSAAKRAVAPAGGKQTILTPAKAKASSAKAKAKSRTEHMSDSASREDRQQELQNMRGKAIQGHVRAREQRKQAKRDGRVKR